MQIDCLPVFQEINKVLRFYRENAKLKKMYYYQKEYVAEVVDTLHVICCKKFNFFHPRKSLGQETDTDIEIIR